MSRGFAEPKVFDALFRCDDSRLAACFRAIEGSFAMHAQHRVVAWRVASLDHIFKHPAVKRVALSVLATHVAASVLDFYITKYSAKPMEQLQNLVTQYALGIQRLEADEGKDAAEVSANDLQKEDPKRRAKRVTLRLQFGANRASWVSATKCAL